VIEDFQFGRKLHDGKRIRLEILSNERAEQLLHAGTEVPWRYMPSTLNSESSISKWITESTIKMELGEEIPYAVVLTDANLAIGSTRFMDIQWEHKGVEIGWTWLSRDYWGSGINTECKYLMLEHAFEDWGAIRVQLKADSENLRSRAAILKLGAKFEGILRNHRFRQDGTIRDTAMYSITRDEWPEVKNKLKKQIHLN